MFVSSSSGIGLPCLSKASPRMRRSPVIGSSDRSRSGASATVRRFDTFVSSGSFSTSSRRLIVYERYARASTNAAIPIEMTMAVRIIACARGSAIVSCRSLRTPTIGALPEGPPTVRISRLTPFPASNKPSSILTTLRSSSRYTPAATSTPITTSRAKLALMSLDLDFRVETRPEAAQDVEHQTDDDQVHTRVEEQCGHHLDVPEQRQRDLQGCGRQGRGAEEQGGQRRACREGQAQAQDLARVEGKRLAQFVPAAGQISQHQGEP